jgi:NAD(P)-dependent dehydrogenase (short-subunit alcohol dehydrogenase family)
MDLRNRVVIITGATGNLGKVVALRFAQEGARLALFGTDAQRLGDLTSALNLKAENVLPYQVDLRDRDQTMAATAAVIDKFGHADIWLHFVGGWIGGKPVVETSAGDIEEMLQQHLWTTFHLAQAVVPQMVSNHWGRVIVVSSPTAIHPPPKRAPYAVGKAAQETLILALAQEVKDAGVTVNILQVSTIDVNHERDRQPTPKNASWTTPEEILSAILYLCSDEAQAVNGARIPLFHAD